MDREVVELVKELKYWKKVKADEWEDIGDEEKEMITNNIKDIRKDLYDYGYNFAEMDIMCEEMIDE